MLQPLDTGLDAFPVVTLTADEVAAVARGQFVRPAGGLPGPGRALSAARRRRDARGHRHGRRAAGSRPTRSSSRRTRGRRRWADPGMHVVEGIDGLRPDLGPDLRGRRRVRRAASRPRLPPRAPRRGGRGRATPGRPSSPSITTPTRSCGAPRRRSCSTRTNGSNGWPPRASRSRSSSTSTRRCGRRRTTRSWSASAPGSRLSGFLMTPDAAFGYERRGTPASLADARRARRVRRRRRPAVHPRRPGRPQLGDPGRDRGRRPGGRRAPPRPAGHDHGCGRRRDRWSVAARLRPAGRAAAGRRVRGPRGRGSHHADGQRRRPST